MLESHRHLKDDGSVGAFQFAFKLFGCEQIIHAVRAALRADPNAHAILVDCSNAFNRLRRQAIREVLMSDARFNCVRALFNAFYAEQGDLVVRGEGGEHPVISSSEGVRQGDVLGPLLFCIALKPAITRALEQFNLLLPGKSVSVYAYMDDITIVGDASASFEFFTLLERELAGIGLDVNRSKTVMTSPLFQSDMRCRVESCFKLLGAFVSRNPAEEKAEVDRLIEPHEPLFNRLTQLPAEVGYRLLIACGVPRWAHIIRTHEPAVSGPASVAFTEMSVRCLAAILRVDYNTLADCVLRQIRMPVRCGGLGLHDWSERAEDAYAMSLSMQRSRAGSQDELDAFAPSCSREESYWEAALEEIKKEHPEFHAHLSKFQSKMANAWLRGDMTLASAMASNTFRAAVLFRLNWAGPDTSSPAPLPCVCGFPKRNIASVTRQAMMMHQAGCSKNGGPTKRHHAVRDALATVMTEAGYSCRREVEIGQTGEGANVEPLRMDIVATPPNGEPIYVDVTIANSASRSHANRPVDATFAKADAAKRAKYEEAARSNGCKYLTFAMDVFGKLSKDSLSFLQSLTTSMKARCADKVERELITVAATFSGISKALAFGNGSCLLYSNQLLKMYGISLKGEPPCIRAPPGFRHLGSDAVDAACAPTSEPDVTAACESEDELSDGDAGELCCVPGEGFVACEEDEAVAPLRVAA